MRHYNTAPLWLLLSSLLLTGGCEGQHYAAAQRQDTVAAYQRYLAQHPQGEQVSAARERLELLRYRAARRSDRPLAYHAYLAQFPQGRYSAACRLRLATLALNRAKTAEDFKLLLERYPDSPEAEQVERTLPLLLARQALESRAPELSRAFLERYPAAAQAREVRQHLAGLVYPGSGAGAAALERFIDEFAGTAKVAEARGALETLWAQELQVLATPELLARFQQRFPQSEHLAGLNRAVLERALLRATAEVRPAELAELARESGEVGEAASWLHTYCRRRAADCDQLRRLSARALPFQPQASLAVLREQAFHPDSDVSWQGIAALSFLPQPQAGATLLELVGSSRLSVVWAGRNALETWLRRRSPQERSFWLAFQRRQLPPLSVEEIEQRQGYLALLAGDPQEEQLLEPLSAEPARALAAGYLLISGRHARREPAGNALRERFFQAAQGRLDALEEAFPRDLHQDSSEAAILVEREGFALGQVLSELAPTATSGPARREEEALARRAAATLRRWLEQLASLDSYVPPRIPQIVEQAALHDAQRGESLVQLRRRRGTAAQRVAAAVCAAAPLPAACPAASAATKEEQ